MSLNPQASEMWNKRYDAKDYFYGIEPNIFLKDYLKNIKPGRILFPCEGEGRNAVYAASEGWDVLAYDFSEVAKNKALLLAKSKKLTIEYQISSSDTFATDLLFDAVGLFYTHFAEPARSNFFQTNIRLLKTNGIIFGEVFEKTQLRNSSGGPQNETMLYSVDEVEKLLNDLKIIKLSKERIMLSEGAGHIGDADVIRFVGQK